MIYFIMYILIVSEFLFLSFFYLVQWRQHKRRRSDIYSCVAFIMLGVSYSLYALSSSYDTRMTQLFVDFILATLLYIVFFSRVKEQWKLICRQNKHKTT